MVLVCQHGHYLGSLPGVTELWQAGESRDVPADTAAYLLATFPGKFAEPSAPIETLAEVIDAPPTDRAMKPPRARGGATSGG